MYWQFLGAHVFAWTEKPNKNWMSNPSGQGFLYMYKKIRVREYKLSGQIRNPHVTKTIATM